mgnify:CR=1 FL=1
MSLREIVVVSPAASLCVHSNLASAVVLETGGVAHELGGEHVTFFFSLLWICGSPQLAPLTPGSSSVRSTLESVISAEESRTCRTPETERNDPETKGSADEDQRGCGDATSDRRQ